MRDIVISKIAETKLIAIVRGIADKELCLKVVRAIFEGGIGLIEVTFNQSEPHNFSHTTDAISAICKEFGDKVCVGAGTVLTPQQVKMAAEAGAKYIISPSADCRVIQKTRELGLVSIPGVVTPTEIAMAMDAGADFCKLFPAGNFGCEYIKAIKAPLSHVKILAVGGINAENIPQFLASGCDGFGIGSNLVNLKWAKAGEYEKITQVARSLCDAVEQA